MHRHFAHHAVYSHALSSVSKINMAKPFPKSARVSATMRTFISILSTKSEMIERRRGVPRYFLYRLRLSSKPCSQPFPPPTYFKPEALLYRIRFDTN